MDASDLPPAPWTCRLTAVVRLAVPGVAPGAVDGVLRLAAPRP